LQKISFKIFDKFLIKAFDLLYVIFKLLILF
jgi:hypothetical protein